jgi:hypothetical protein
MEHGMARQLTGLSAASIFTTLCLAVAEPAPAATWEYSNNGKGNHYLLATDVADGAYSVTFACNGTKVIGFFTIAEALLPSELKRAKVVYAVTRIDGDAVGSGRYAWLAGTPQLSDKDFDVYLPSGKPVINLLRDLQSAETELAISVTADNPAKGQFQTEYAFAFDADGAADGVSALFQACNVR